MKLLFTHRCTWRAVETSETIEESKELPQFVEERTRQQRCYRLEFDEALGESRGTIVPPTPELQHQDPRQFESKTTRVKVPPYYEADTDDNASNGVCRVYLHFASRNYCPCIWSAARARNQYHFGMRCIVEARKSGYRLTIPGVPDLSHFISAKERCNKRNYIVWLSPLHWHL